MGRFVSATGQFLLATYEQFSRPPTGSFSCPLTVEQIASSQGIPLDSARGYVRGVEELLSGKLPTTPSRR